nr:MAG TPA: hypothetical protein [Siphoviridae sp. ctHdl3]
MTNEGGYNMEPEYLRDPNEVAFEDYMKRLGDKIKRQNKNLMINPAAMQRTAEIIKYFKVLQSEDNEYNVKVTMSVDSMIAYNAMIVVNFEEFGRVKSQYENFIEILKLCDSFNMGAGPDETVTLNMFVEHYLVKI